MTSALLIVDVQNDFLPGGALPAAGGEKILPIINALIDLPFSRIVASQDWHPPGHGSFASSYDKNPGEHIDLDGIDQTLWPDHCIQNTEGAAFSNGWSHNKVDTIIQKGTLPHLDSYSAFFDNAHRHATKLEKDLREHGIQRLFIVGLVTEYCVGFSALDALTLGFETYVILDACQNLEIHAGDTATMLDKIKEQGGTICSSKEIKSLI